MVAYAMHNLFRQATMERRMFPRREVRAALQGKRLDQIQHRPDVTLALRDLSLGGLSALCDMPLNRGERLAVYFPPEGRRRGWDASGRVIRCEASSTGYRLAVEFDPLPIAA